MGRRPHSVDLSGTGCGGGGGQNVAPSGGGPAFPGERLLGDPLGRAAGGDRRGDAAAAPGGKSRSPLEPHAAWLKALVADEPDLTLAELEHRILPDGLGLTDHRAFAAPGSSRAMGSVSKKTSTPPTGAAGRGRGAHAGRPATEPRSEAPGVRRRDRDLDQDGPPLRALSARPAADWQGALGALEDHRLHLRTAL